MLKNPSIVVDGAAILCEFSSLMRVQYGLGGVVENERNAKASATESDAMLQTALKGPLPNQLAMSFSDRRVQFASDESKPLHT